MTQTILTPPRVLIVDDELAIRLSLELFLQDHGFQVATADSAEAAHGLLAQGAFDVAIVDLRLPDLSGEALIGQLHARYPGLRFLIHTGSLDYQPAPALARIGIGPQHVLVKPVKELQAFVKAIQALIQAPGAP